MNRGGEEPAGVMGARGQPGRQAALFQPVNRVGDYTTTVSDQYYYIIDIHVAIHMSESNTCSS